MALVLPAYSEMGSKHLNCPDEDCCCQPYAKGMLPGATAAAHCATITQGRLEQLVPSGVETDNLGITMPIDASLQEQQLQQVGSCLPSPAAALANCKRAAMLDMSVQPTSPQNTPCSAPFSKPAAKRARMSRLSTTTYALRTPTKGVLCKDSGAHDPDSTQPECIPEAPRAMRGRSDSHVANPFAWTVDPEPIPEDVLPEDALPERAEGATMHEDNFLASLLPAPLPFALPVPLLNRPMFAAQANPSLLMTAAAGWPAIPGLEFLASQQQPLLDDAALNRLTGAPYLANAPTTAARRLCFGQDAVQPDVPYGAVVHTGTLDCPWTQPGAPTACPASPASSCCSAAPAKATPSPAGAADQLPAAAPSVHDAAGQPDCIPTGRAYLQHRAEFDWLFEDAYEAHTRTLSPRGGPSKPPALYSPQMAVGSGPCMAGPPSLEGAAAGAPHKAMEPIFGLSLRVRVAPRGRTTIPADLCMSARPGTPAPCC